MLLWNLAEQRVELTLRYGSSRRTVGIEGLDVALVEGIDV